MKKKLSLLFVAFALFALAQCARRGSPSGGPKDVDPPVLVEAEPENFSINFDSNTIKLYFDEFIKLEDVQNQLIISPPLKYVPEITPQGGPRKFIEIEFKDTLRENTTYTINFGQSIVDNNEGNPKSFFSYVFSTGSYIDSLSLSGAVKDAYARTADPFVSVMLYEIDSAYTDSTIYKYPPNYITSTTDSLPFFQLNNLKEGRYKIFALKDEGKNNVFDQNADKIGFLKDTITLPTDSVYLLSLFKEIPDYKASVPSYSAKNKIIFGFTTIDSTIKIEALTEIPDSVKTTVLRDGEKDTLNYWLTPTDLDSIVFAVTNEKAQASDTFTVRTRNLPMDTLTIRFSPAGKINFEERFKLMFNTPVVSIDSAKFGVFDQDTLPIPFSLDFERPKNELFVDFELSDDQRYLVNLLPGAVTDYFGSKNDTLNYSLSTGSYADYGSLRFNLEGAINYPIIAQLTDERGNIKREQYAEAPRQLVFNNLQVGNYTLRIIYDDNGNQEWDTGNYLQGKQPERIVYFPDLIEMRANWEEIKTFFITE